MPPLPESDRPLVGRTDELADLTTRAVESGTPSLTLLGGDAGVGKTRLLTALTGRAQDAGARVLLGHCLDLGDSSAPYLPVAEMFARLAQDDHQLAQRIVADRPLLGSVLPEFYRRDVPADLPRDRGSFFDAVHMVLEELAETTPVVAVIEDAHWADRSTRELLTFLFTRRFKGPVSLVVSYRSDDLHRRHPLRPKLAEWSRLPGMHRLMLDPLTDAEVRDLLHQLRPSTSTEDATTIVERAGGNPFFAEELLAASEIGGHRLSEELADLLLVRIDALDDDARSVVRAASVAGRAVDHVLLAQVVALSGRDLDRALRAVVDSHVFEVTTTGKYAFRHALLAEAVYDDLLPGERVQLHWDFADALRERTGASASAALARHARAAGNHELAVQASVRAGDEAMASAGPADAARHYEDALSMLAEHPAVVPPEPAAALVVKASRALVAAGNPHRAADLAGEAYERHTGDLRERAELVVALVRARVLADVPDVGTPLVREAISWVEAGEPVPVLAALYAVLARALICDDEFDGAVLAATEAASLARDLDLPGLVTDALTSLARLDDFTGDPARAEEALIDVVQRARDAQDASAELRALHQLARVQARLDRFRDAYFTHVRGYERARETGHVTDPFGIETRVFGALYALMVGEWDAADRLLAAEKGDRLPPLVEATANAVRMVRDAGRGEPRVLDALPALRPLWQRDMFVCVHTSAVAVDVYGANGDLDSMLQVYDDTVDTFTSVWCLPSFDARIRLSALAIGHITTAVVQGRVKARAYAERVGALAAAVEDVVAKRRTEDALGLESRAWVSRARAELARFEWAGRGAVPDELVTHWEDVVRVFDEADHPFEVAVARLRLAEVLAAADRRPEARALLDQVRETAERLGARGLVAAAARGRRTSQPTDDAQVALTPREREVLTLVAEGRTNGEIATALFISAKTASVHVSNILAKVGAATRTEAAAIARRDALI
ncbi:AAA family ATPase [Luteipulveratus sp. YIM 133132]|uniref:helix-turn-helix transcriptional regulator n=1 Tax=Luteipulveratus flavus TaxID=3031728 RepID=UPI0023AFCBCB|nr:helix-turn-helix transcriptional regulator [Luteipulveratus sp. YIM 133132]MDE9366698.1 AAA family ATPase [Luteipulveratus sp. YIM 133132]